MAGLGFELSQSGSRTPTLNCCTVLSARPSSPPDSVTPPQKAAANSLSTTEESSQSLPTNPGATRPHPSGPLVQNLLPSLPCPSVLGAHTSFFVVDLVLFCLFPFTPFPGRLSKATFYHQGTQKGQGLSQHLGFPKPQPPASAQWLGEPLRYLFIYLVLLSSTPPKLLLPTGEDEKRLQTMEDKACHMASSV